MVFVKCKSSITSTKEATIVVSTVMFTPSIRHLALINVYKIKHVIVSLKLMVHLFHRRNKYFVKEFNLEDFDL